MKKAKNNLLFLFYTVILGAIVGLIVWAFLRVMNLGIGFLWDFVPSQVNFPLYTLLVCTAGGLLIGLWKRRFGDYPEELGKVLGTVKKTGGYPYHNVFSTLGSALFPLLIGASVGPEAGLTGVIAGLCTWVGDKLRRFRSELDELTAIGLSATLGTIFKSPMFGFIEPIESEKETVLPKTSKIVLYFAAIPLSKYWIPSKGPQTGASNSEKASTGSWTLPRFSMMRRCCWGSGRTGESRRPSYGISERASLSTGESWAGSWIPGTSPGWSVRRRRSY